MTITQQALTNSQSRATISGVGTGQSSHQERQTPPLRDTSQLVRSVSGSPTTKLCGPEQVMEFLWVAVVSLRNGVQDWLTAGTTCLEQACQIGPDDTGKDREQSGQGGVAPPVGGQGGDWEGAGPHCPVPDADVHTGCSNVISQSPPPLPSLSLPWGHITHLLDRALHNVAISGTDRHHCTQRAR